MLAGIKILDLTRYLPGPLATRHLCDLGAEVIKIEGPDSPDPFRSWPPFDEDGFSVAYRALNRGKSSISIDLKSPAGVELFLRLVEKADVVVEGFRPGVLHRLGVGPEACAKRNPGLVFCSISGFGQDGPYRDRPGHDVCYLAYSGVLSITVDREGTPILPGIQIGDTLGAFAALAGILTALCKRERTGEGEIVDASMLDALVGTQTLQLVPHLAGIGRDPSHGRLSGGYPCYGVYSTSDGGAVALGALEAKFWRAFCRGVGRDEWVERQFDPGLVPEIVEMFSRRTRDEWRDLLEDFDCCLAPVLSHDELPADPQVRARELLAGGRLATPVRFSSFAGKTEPDEAGESDDFLHNPGTHTAGVLEKLLGLDADEIDSLAGRGTISLGRWPTPDDDEPGAE